MSLLWRSECRTVMKITHTRTKEAFERGYHVSEDGSVRGPKGPLSVKLYGKQRYPTFTTNWGGRVYGIPVHYLAAYCFYGEESFREDLVIRHLNGNTLDVAKSNIAMGTHSDNNNDKCPKVRSEAAKKARAAQGKAAKNRKLTEEQAEFVREYYRNLEGRRAPNGEVSKLSKRLGVSRTVLNKIKKGEYYAS